MASIDPLTRWTELSEAEQLQAWRSFLSSLDAGDAGYHRYYAELMPRSHRGDVPKRIEAERSEDYEAEVRSEVVWEPEHAFDPDWAILTLGDPPF